MAKTTDNAEKLLKRYEKLKSDRQLWDALWQEIGYVIHPRRSTFTVKTSPGSKQTERLFDSTALDAHDRLAATLNGTLTSRAAKWFGLKMRDEKMNNDKDTAVWLESCSKRMFEAFNQSNFAQEIHEVYLDETAFGTSGIYVEERDPQGKDFHGFIFTAMPLDSFCIDEDKDGRVDTVYREFQLSARNAFDKFKDNGQKVLDAIKDGKDDKMFCFVHCIMPRKDANQDPTPSTPRKKLPWASIYLSVEDKCIVQEGGFHEFPAMVPRWSKSSGEKYGRGPGHLALPDVKTLNKVKEITLRMMGKALDPPTMSEDDGVVGMVRNMPAGNTVVRSTERSIKPLFPPGFFRESLGSEQIKSEELKASIRRIFYADQMELPTGPAMTAFEVAKRWELLTRMIGTTIGRQETELLNPLISRTFGIMFRHGAFDLPPAALAKGGADIDVVFEGPLAKSQRLSEVEGMERLNTLVISMAQLDPSVIDNIDYDEAVRDAADVLGVPKRVVRDKDETDQIRKTRAEQQAQQQQKQDLAQLAEGAGKAAPALKLMQQNGSLQNAMPGARQ